MPHVEEHEDSRPIVKRLESQGITAEAANAMEQFPGRLGADIGFARGVQMMDTRDTLERDFLHGGTAFPETIADADRGFGMTPADIHAAGTAGTMSPAAYRMHRERLLAEQGERRSGVVSGDSGGVRPDPVVVDAAQTELDLNRGQGTRVTPELLQQRRDAARASRKQRLSEINERRQRAGLDPIPDPDEAREAQSEAMEAVRQRRAEGARMRLLMRSEVGREILRREDEERRQQEMQAQQEALAGQEQQAQAIEREQEQVEQRRKRVEQITSEFESGRNPAYFDENGVFLRGPYKGKAFGELSPEQQGQAIRWALDASEIRDQVIAGERPASSGQLAPADRVQQGDSGGDRAVRSVPEKPVKPSQRPGTVDVTAAPAVVAAKMPTHLKPPKGRTKASPQDEERVVEWLLDNGFPADDRDKLESKVLRVMQEAGWEVE